MFGKETVTGIRQRDNHWHLANIQSLVLGKEPVTGIRHRDIHCYLAKRQSLVFGKERVTGIRRGTIEIITGYIRRGGRRELRWRARIERKVNAKH